MKDFQLLIYSTPTEDVKVDVVLKDENIWATQKAMSLLFGIGVPGINKHIKHIFETGELKPEVVISKMETTTIHGAMADKTQSNDTMHGKAFYVGKIHGYFEYR